MITDLHMDPPQFRNANTVFFATYVAFEIIGNLLVKRFSPKRTLPVMITVWGIILVSQSFVKNYGGLVTTRVCQKYLNALMLTTSKVLLGVAESGLFPGAIYIISLYYPRQEQALRMGFLFSACVLAGAFGGVLAYGLSQMRGIGGLPGWAWIFCIEGLASFVVGIFSFWAVVDLPSNASFLDERQRAFVIHRIKQGQGALSLDVNFNWSHVYSAFLDFRMYGFAALYFMAGALLYSLATFSPTIIKELGDWSTAQSQLLTVPPYAAAFITTVASAYISDRTGKRAYIVIVGSFISLIGYIVIQVVPNTVPGVKYFAIFVSVSGFSPAAATVLAWGAGSFGPTYKRGVTQGFIMMCGNSAGILSAYLYPDDGAPDFRIGHSVSAAFSFAIFVLAIVMFFVLKRDNRKRDEKYGTLEEIYTIIQQYGSKESINEKDTESPTTSFSMTKNEFVDLPHVLLERWGLHGYSREDIANLGDKHPMFRYLC
ncbi:transporter [Wallemia mellicola CBS 633.66]|uniref:Transporter n=1 Tax=Wallemia mellicola (strain ATCC MYA-4683 / CBS 633.66) TaxID=671144 RepID=I4YB77_WALMC|nr:transporter [Wallemia mellicola CBS 633.66]EIM21219.1 transporter [Wallemia mellicola CBS 633.66]|eukprot:XP_006958891.1 transporter [Wallemia mellicola CBS 633.66]